MRQASLKSLGFFFVFFLSTATTCHQIETATTCRQEDIQGTNTTPTKMFTLRQTTEKVDSERTPPISRSNSHASGPKSVGGFIMGSPEENCDQIKQDPELLNLYHSFMGSAKEPTPEDMKLIRIAAVVLTDLDNLKLNIGEKITHPIFGKYPNLKPFLRDRIVQHYSKFDIEKPLNAEDIRAITQFRNTLFSIILACKKGLRD